MARCHTTTMTTPSPMGGGEIFKNLHETSSFAKIHTVGCYIPVGPTPIPLSTVTYKMTTPPLLLVAFVSALFPHTHALSGTLQMVGVDNFSQDMHFAFCALKQDTGKMIALDNIFWSHCISGTEVELEAAITVAVNLTNDVPHVHEPFQLDHGVVTKVNSVYGAGINALHGIETLKSQLDMMTKVAVDRHRQPQAITSSVTNLLIVRVRLADDYSVDTYCNETCALSIGWGLVSARSSFLESSYGALDISATPDHVQTVTLRTTKDTYSDCDFDKLGDDAVTALSTAGFSTDTFDMVSFMMPQEISHCTFSGLSYVGGNRSWVRSGSVDVLTHQLGHNLGMWHASTDLDNDGIQDSEYGDSSCIMGNPNSLITWNAPHRIQMNWMPSEAVATLECPTGAISCEETYTINDLQLRPSTLAGGGYSVVKTPRGDGAGDYYISYRAETGMDANLQSTYKEKVSVHYWAEGNTELVTTLGVGQSFTDVMDVFGTPTEVLKVTVLKTTHRHVHVKVERFDHTPVGCVNVDIHMTDSYGDGWNGVNLYLVPDKSTFVTLRAGSWGTSTVCLPPGTYWPFACDGSGSEEVEWTIVGYDMSGGASTECVPPSGSFSVTSTIPATAPSTKTPTMTPTEHPTRTTSVIPTRPLTMTPSPPAGTGTPTDATECVAVVVTMTDTRGDGWNGNLLQLNSQSVTLASGYSGTVSICLPVGVYTPTCCGGDWPSEVGWSITTTAGVSVAAGRATSTCVNLPPFSVVEPTTASSSVPTTQPTLNPTLLATVVLTSISTGADNETRHDDCIAADFAKMLDNQEQMLTLLQFLAASESHELGRDDIHLASPSPSSGSSNEEEYTAVVYALTTVGGVSVLVAAIAFFLHRNVVLHRLGYATTPTSVVAESGKVSEEVDPSHEYLRYL